MNTAYDKTENSNFYDITDLNLRIFTPITSLRSKIVTTRKQAGDKPKKRISGRQSTTIHLKKPAQILAKPTMPRLRQIASRTKKQVDGLNLVSMAIPD